MQLLMKDTLAHMKGDPDFGTKGRRNDDVVNFALVNILDSKDRKQALTRWREWLPNMFVRDLAYWDRDPEEVIEDCYGRYEGLTQDELEYLVIDAGYLCYE